MSTATARYAGAFAIVAAIFGCGLSRARGGSVTIPSLSSLQPQANPGPKANLDYGGSVIPVELAYSLTGNTETIDSQFQGEQFEHEEYSVSPTEFALIATSDEQFNPPIPLITDNKSQQSWSGTFSTAGLNHPATATVTVSVGSLSLSGKKEPSVVSTVELSIESGGPAAAKRTLKFTFVQGQGVVQREFSAGVKRLPEP